MDEWSARIDAGELRYAILDPTGNITALVESDVRIDDQPAAARAIMQRHPLVEQVGFVSNADEGLVAHMRMAGGEFCGNATMSAAALCLMRLREALGVVTDCVAGNDSDGVTVPVRVWGIEEPVEVRLRLLEDGGFRGGVRMPAAHGVEVCSLSLGSLSGQLPLVRMVGISHLVIEPESVFQGLRTDCEAAERAVRAWCAELEADGLGLMFVVRDDQGLSLTPLVYVPGGDTVFWENSCASGTSAVGIYLATKTGAPIDVTLREPGGCLRVTSDPAGGDTWLYGSVRMVKA